MDRVIPHLKFFLSLTLFSLIILGLDLLHFLSLPKKILSLVTNPISVGLYQTNKDIFKQFNFIYSARLSSQQNKALKEQLALLLSENARLRKELAEAKALNTQILHLDPATYNLLPARPMGIKRFLKIDKGSESKVNVGQAVIFNDNYVGKIVTVSEKSSNIQLLTDPESKVSAFSQGLEGKAKGVLIGQFGNELLLDKILHEEKINIGDLVYSEGTEGFLPRGLILGRVTQILEQENSVFKQASLKPNFDISDIDLVFVILE